MSKYLDSTGLSHYTEKIKDGTIVAGKANSVPASGITGVIDMSHIPQGAQERLVKVANQAARFKLTANDVQLGDTVQDVDTGLMWFVVDTSKLNSAAGYQEYTAGTASKAATADNATNASKVPWSGVQNPPTTLSGYGITDGFNRIKVIKTASTTPNAPDPNVVFDVSKADSHTISVASGYAMSGIKLGDTTKQASAALIPSFSKEELSVASTPIIEVDSSTFKGIENAPQGMSILVDATADSNGGHQFLGIVYTYLRNNILDQSVLFIQGTDIYAAWGSYSKDSSPNFKSSGTHLLTNKDEALTNDEIDAAIAAAK